MNTNDSETHKLNMIINVCPICGKQVKPNDDQIWYNGKYYHYECFING